jgi:hypothetical protein
MALDLDARHHTLIFRATPWSDRAVRRVFEVAPDHTLADLHRCIVDEFQLDDDHLWAFYLSGEWFDRTSEFEGTPDFTGKAQTTKVGELGLLPDDFLAYLCDFGDEQRVDVELLRYGDASDLDRPRVLERTGVAQGRSFEWDEDDDAPEEVDPDAADCPRQGAVEEPPDAPRLEGPPKHDLVQLEPAEAAALEAALSAWSSNGEDDTRRISLGADRIAAAASAVLERCIRPAQLSALGWRSGVRLDAWLGDAIRSVAAHGDADVASKLAERFSAVTAMRHPWLQAARAFAGAGRAEAARGALACAARCDRPFPQSVRLGIAEVLTMLGDSEGAEAEFRRLTSCRWPSPRIRPLAAEALADLLQKTGRGVEASEVHATERLRREALAGVVRRAGPRVGRNDPCPCGSGRKAKKCCGT